jgi:hypothetical protein
MSKWKNKDGKTVHRNQIATQFAWQAIDMLEGPAFRVLSLSARRVIDRIQIEHAHHGGKENGKLPVTFRDFKEYGIHWNSIAPAIREAEALGFIRVTQEGIASNKEFRIPNMFALTHLPTDKDPKPAEDWKRIKTVEEAAVIAAASRKAPARFSRFQRKKKSGLRYGNRIERQYGNRIEGRKFAEGRAIHLATLLPGYAITIIADHGKDRIEVTSGPSERYVAFCPLCGRARVARSRAAEARRTSAGLAWLDSSGRGGPRGSPRTVTPDRGV